MPKTRGFPGLFLIREEMREQFESQVGSKYEGIL